MFPYFFYVNLFFCLDLTPVEFWGNGHFGVGFDWLGLPATFHLCTCYVPLEPSELTALMRSVATAYSMYFNKRHKSKGHLFQGIYRASRIDSDSYLAHISRYIHLNPRTYRTYYWSSLKEYLGERITPWIHPERVLDTSPVRYLEFLEDYEDRRDLLKCGFGAASCC